MSETKHTRGPWQAREETTYWVITSPHHTYSLAQTTCHQMHYTEHRANARLFAAAPLLLEACKMARETVMKLAVPLAKEQGNSAMVESLLQAAITSDRAVAATEGGGE